MNPADKFLIFFGLLDLFYDYPLDFGSIIHPKFFFLYMGYFDSVSQMYVQQTFLEINVEKSLEALLSRHQYIGVLQQMAFESPYRKPRHL